MDRRKRSALAGLTVGLAALTAVAVAAPDANPPTDPVPARHVAPAPVQPAQTACQSVDANGVPLVDSQYLQRTGHAPC